MASEETTLSAQMFHTTFVTSLDVDMSTCMSNTEVVTCELMYVNAVGGEESIQKNTSVCGECHLALHHTLAKCKRTHVPLHHSLPV